MADLEVKTDGPALSPLEEPADIGPEPSRRGCSGCSWKAVLVLGVVLGAVGNAVSANTGRARGGAPNALSQ